MHGQGRLYYPNGKMAYEGGWKFGEFSGMGKVYNDESRISNEAFDFTDLNQLGEEWVYY
jgi:antitoxin component YwqK of YwqJK toxin-antitoxin module